MPRKTKEEKKKESKKPEKQKLSQSEYEKRIKELAEKGMTSEKIGETLRKEGIHPKEYSGKIAKIMGPKYSPADIINLNKKLESLKKHVEKNKQDKRAMREKDRIFAHLRKLKKYFKLE